METKRRSEIILLFISLALSTSNDANLFCTKRVGDDDLDEVKSKSLILNIRQKESS